MLQSKSFVKKKSSSFTPLQESPKANLNFDISKARKRAKEAFLGGHLGNLKQTHIHYMLKFRIQNLLVDSQSSQPTDQDELKSPYYGAVIYKACHFSFARLRSVASPILIIDIDVMLHQIALFENPVINIVVVISEVQEDVISRNMEVYYRIKALCTNATKNFFVFYSEHHRDVYVEGKVEESPNDRTDRAIRVSAHWYQSHLAGSIQILLITNNRESKKNAIEEGLSSETVESYVRSLQQHNLQYLVAIPTSLDILKEELDDLRLSKQEVIYRPAQFEFVGNAYEATTNWKRSFNTESIEVKFQMDAKTHDPLDIGIYSIREANQMIEEFMLACNFSVAEMILKQFPSCSLLQCAMSVNKSSCTATSDLNSINRAHRGSSLCFGFGVLYMEKLFPYNRTTL